MGVAADDVTLKVVSGRKTNLPTLQALSHYIKWTARIKVKKSNPQPLRTPGKPQALRKAADIVPPFDLLLILLKVLQEHILGSKSVVHTATSTATVATQQLRTTKLI